MNRRADRPVMLRSGGEVRGVPAFTATGPRVLMADISEFQADIADAAYLSWSKAIAVRAMYGAEHDDGAWYGGARRDALHAGGVKFLGIYQYLVASQDAAMQAHALVNLVGRLRPGEKLVCDLEEGEGDQSVRWRQWSAVIAAAYGTAHGAMPWLYSGLYFASAHGLRPQWLAAYQGSEPAASHILWQFTPAFPVPGVGLADASVFRGTIEQLAAYTYGGQPAPPSPQDWQEVMMQQLPVLREGATGADVRTVQGLLVARGRTVTVDGVFGPATVSAVRALQASRKLATDGAVGPMTWPALMGI